MARLHVAAMPFPSVQGTQAAVRAMVDAEHEAGLAPELLTYAHGAFELRTPWPHHRIADLTRDRGLRSGPSLRKVVQDAQLAVAARQRAGASKPDAVVAHHVEAASACLAARVGPLHFVAHTALEPELPTYLPKVAAKLAARAGGALDERLVKSADRAFAVSPWLAEHLQERTGSRVEVLHVPWSVPPPIEPEERSKARQRFGFEALEPVVLYAGNLDAYQSLPVLVRAFVALLERRPEARLLVASASDAASFESELWSAGAASRVTFAPLADEPDRRCVHAAADAVWVPRATPGGLPMKLLDALSRGVPTVVSRCAAAGFDLAGCAMLAPDDDPEGLAASTLLGLESREGAASLGRRGREYVEAQHSPARYLANLRGR